MKLWGVVLGMVVWSIFPILRGRSDSLERRDTSIYTAYKDTTVTRFFRRKRGWIAADGGFSIPVNDGTVLWLFGDSHIDDYDPKTGRIPVLFQVRNSGMIQPEGDWHWQHTATLTGDGSELKSFFKRQSEEDDWFWPGAGFRWKDTIFVFLSRLKKDSTETANFAFQHDSPDYWGKVAVEDKKVVDYSALPDFGGISFGKGFVKDEKSGYVYAYGTKRSIIEGKLFVARIPLDKLEAPWQFWNGKGWTKKVEDAVAIGKTASTSVNVSQVKGKYLALSSEFSVGCDQGNRIFASVSDKPTGPFSTKKTIYKITDTLNGHYPFFYFPIAHPEYINDHNELLITYSINGYGDCVDYIQNHHFNPDYYRPKAIRIPLDILF